MQSCIICGRAPLNPGLSECSDYEYGVPYSGDLMKCPFCRLYMISPFPEFGAIDSFYPEDYANFSEPHSVLSKLLIKLYESNSKKEIKTLIGSSGAVLDVGCSDGHYLDILKGEEEWELWGTEISETAVEKASRKGHKVLRGSIEDLPLPSNYFDIIRVNHVIEHLINPVAMLEKAFELLTPRGYLLIETPNVSCPDFLFLKRYWGALHFPRHLFLFSKKSMKLLLSKTGFRILATEDTLMTTGWALGCQNYISELAHIKKVFGRAWFYPFLLVMFTPFLMIQKILKCSTMVKYVARKKEK